MSAYKQSDGTWIDKHRVDRNISMAKSLKVKQMSDQYGYLFCEDCYRSDNGVECSHDVSVKTCQDNNWTELAWDIRNLTMRCRKCHDKWDNQPSQERIKKYKKALI